MNTIVTKAICSQNFWFFFVSRRNRGVLHCILGLMMLAVAIGVTIGTMQSKRAGLYILYTGKQPPKNQLDCIMLVFFSPIYLLYLLLHLCSLHLFRHNV